MPPIGRLRLAVMNTSLFELDGVLFDLDGVLTSTATLHAAAWKATFDTVLEELAGPGRRPQRPFDGEDYRRYVDGRPRSDGVRSFLASRNLSLPEGDTDDPSSRLTVASVARRKDQLLQQHLAAGGITAFPGSVAFVRRLRARGLRTAVVSASRNCLRSWRQRASTACSTSGSTAKSRPARPCAESRPRTRSWRRHENWGSSRLAPL